MSLLTVFLQSGSSNPMSSLVFIGLILVVFYFFMIRPQSKKQKEQRTFTESLQKGDNVVTASGMLGKINKIEENIITLEVGTKTYIRVTRNAISKDMTEGIYSPEKK